jgi:iron complex transport system permease protein
MSLLHRHPRTTLGATLLVLTAASLLIGPLGVGLPPEAARRTILLEIRLPRTLLALLIGGGLGIAGAALQGYLRNALAEPGLLGATGGAGLGAVVAIHTGASAAVPLALPFGGLLGALVATLAVLGLSAAGRSTAAAAGQHALLISGVAVSTLATALISLALNLSPNPFAAVEMVHWLMGSIADRSLDHVVLAGPGILLGAALLARLGPDLDALSLGEDAAHNLGTDIHRVRWLIIIGTTLVVGAATAVAGTIGFIGLIVPHLLRPWVGARPGALLVASMLGGATLLLAADIAIRLLSPVGELRLGVLTALLGAPFFLWLIVAGPMDERRGPVS